jgi:hypothetical protein
MVAMQKASADSGDYGALLWAVVAADTPAAAAAAEKLLAEGATGARVYRTVVRTLLPRAVMPARGGWPHGLWALNAALFLADALPPVERAPLLVRAIGLAIGDWPAVDPAPQALPISLPMAGDWVSSARASANRVGEAALAGDGAGAEWALAALLAGQDGGTLPGATARRAAYGAVLAAATQAELRLGAWGHLLVAGQHAVEMAELLPPTHMLLALRPMVWTVARAVQVHQRHGSTTRDPDFDVANLGCALRINRRPPRQGETVQWAIAFDRRPGLRVIEEALASGLERRALLDSAALMAARALSIHAARPTEARSRRIADLAAHALLALHAARRGDDLGTASEEAIIAALVYLVRLSRLVPPLPARVAKAAAASTPQAVARAAVALDTPHALAVGEVVLAEHEDALQRNSEYAQALMATAGVWLARSAAA